MDAATNAQCQKLLNEHWKFIEMEWPVIERKKHHRTVIKDIPGIEFIKDRLNCRLGIISVFFFLTVLFSDYEYSGPYRHSEKGLLLLYHLVSGCSISDMDRYIPGSSFYAIYREFYEKQRSRWVSEIPRLLRTMFSTI